ncbi:DUF4190 domain-containing protein [Nocardia macrotermitis]|uniref:DUF4190 domain-containing protein n=1 Tax=Nocardia macrotermitis TaxID=2585198 RepID=A0A7K0DEB5_9NOCA|nr:DUF4190 domain-containing protein [Nocardia macrotermitis]MQY24008.1 hypothetical protein [Nocardia macrotermitis]
MARRKQSADAQGSTARGTGPWPVAEPDENRWGTAQNRRLPPEPDGQRWDNGSTARHPAPAPAPTARADTGQNRRLSASPEGERWEAAQTRRAPAAEEDGYESTPPRRRTPAAEPDEDYEEPTPSRRRAGRLRVQVPPIVNPYSIVALVAALLGLFPVAIVFGFISFTHPRGRMMALFALLIGAVEVTALVGVLAMSGYTLPHNPFRLQAGSAPASQSSSAPTNTNETAPLQVTVSSAAPTTAAQTAVAQGQACTESQAALIGSTSDGNTLLCLKGASGYRWTGPYTVSTAVYDKGSKCDASGDKSARTADGRALVCEGQGRAATWTLWVE